MTVFLNYFAETEQLEIKLDEGKKIGET